MNTIRFTSKEAFVAALEERRRFWQDFDARQEREHKAAERKYLADARLVLREAVKWDYETLLAKVDWNGAIRIGEKPKCPRLMEPKIDQVLASLKFTQGKAFTVDTQGAWSEAHNLLTWDPDQRTAVC
jgi:hypothetical protein